MTGTLSKEQVSQYYTKETIKEWYPDDTIPEKIEVQLTPKAIFDMLKKEGVVVFK